MKKKLIVIGGGAAGFFCAVNAAAGNKYLQVTIIEKSSKWLSKVRVSGGGRCNVTHDCNSIAEMVKKYPRGHSFLKRAFHHFFTTDTIRWFQSRGVALKTEADGRMFPVTDSSETIIECLLHEANKNAVDILMNRDVVAVETANAGYKITCRDGATFEADFVCIACGGYPKPAQYHWLQSLGHAIEDPVPSLFTFNVPNDPVSALMGITVEEAQVKINGTRLSQQGPLLITHWGFSGPAVLKLSAFAAIELARVHYDFHITINWLPEYNENTMLEKLRAIRNEWGARKVGGKNIFGLPQRLWDYLLSQSNINGEMRWSDLPAKQQNLLAKQLCAQQFHVRGKTTFKEEFVTAGGINLKEIDAQSMQSKKHANLFFAGEILNVDGITGGFNFQHAWTSGWLAAQEIKRKCLQGEDQ